MASRRSFKSDESFLEKISIGAIGTPGHPARFAGSNTTGAAAENLGRRWVAFELDQEYLATSAFRFLQKVSEPHVRELYARLTKSGASEIRVRTLVQKSLEKIVA